MLSYNDIIYSLFQKQFVVTASEISRTSNASYVKEITDDIIDDANLNFHAFRVQRSTWYSSDGGAYGRRYRKQAQDIDLTTIHTRKVRLGQFVVFL